MRTMGLTLAITLLSISAIAQEKGAPAAPAKAAAPAAAPMEPPPPPTLPPEGKKWVESMQGKWKVNDMTMAMGDQKITGKMTLNCEKASGGWGTICKAKMESKGMPAQEMSMLIGWDIAEATAHMFEVANTGEVHDHSGKWADPQTITLVRKGKNVQGKDETDSITFKWSSPKEVSVTGSGTSGGATLWSFTSTAKK
jgi:hypothetical protein